MAAEIEEKGISPNKGWQVAVFFLDHSRLRAMGIAPSARENDLYPLNRINTRNWIFDDDVFSYPLFL